LIGRSIPNGVGRPARARQHTGEPPGVHVGPSAASRSSVVWGCAPRGGGGSQPSTVRLWCQSVRAAGAFELLRQGRRRGAWSRASCRSAAACIALKHDFVADTQLSDSCPSYTRRAGIGGTWPPSGASWTRPELGSGRGQPRARTHGYHLSITSPPHCVVSCATEGGCHPGRVGAGQSGAATFVRARRPRASCVVPCPMLGGDGAGYRFLPDCECLAVESCCWQVEHTHPRSPFLPTSLDLFALGAVFSL
jgi:hypothetical protein